MEPYDEATFVARARQLIATPEGKSPFAPLDIQRQLLAHTLAQGHRVIALQEYHHHL